MEQKVFYYNGQPVQWVNFDGVQTFVNGDDVIYGNPFNRNSAQFSARIKPPVIVDVEWHEVEEPEEEQEEAATEDTEEVPEEEAEDGVC